MTPVEATERAQAGAGGPVRESPDSPSSARQFVNEAYRRRISSALAQLMFERGTESVTVAAIASRAGVSRKAFYVLFENRDDCVDAVLEDALALVAARVQPAHRSPTRWVDRVRGGLRALLELFDEQPEIAQLCVLQAVAAPRATLARRNEVFETLAAVLDEGRAEARTGRTLSPLTAEGVIGGGLSIIHTRMLREESGSHLELLNPLMAMIVLPFLGAAAAKRELTRAMSHKPSTRNRGRAAQNPVKGLEIRLTYRTMRVMTAIAAQSGLSNLQISQCAGITDQGQISKLLARLASAGLAENTGAGQPSGAPNAWRLTPRGEQVHWAFGRDLGAVGWLAR
jgi:AcrR family transcriptional regulator